MGLSTAVLGHWGRMALLAGLGLALTAGPALARGCFPIAERGMPGVHFASLPAGATVGITFLGHASFWIETAGGVTAITDYNGYHVGPEVPTIATMNNAHGTHFTNNPDPGIAHVLRGWNPAAASPSTTSTRATFGCATSPPACTGGPGRMPTRTRSSSSRSRTSASPISAICTTC
jgi:hypothetical protein